MPRTRRGFIYDRVQGKGIGMSYTVWVGGVEVNGYYLSSLNIAQNVANDYIDQGYDDVRIERVSV